MIKLHASEARILQVLRAGEIDRSQLVERFCCSGAMPINDLVRKGLAETSSNGFYKITALGRDNCPTRRAKKVTV